MWELFTDVIGKSKEIEVEMFVTDVLNLHRENNKYVSWEKFHPDNLRT